MLPGIKTVGVIGAGQMGQGIAHVCASAGFNVKMVDISQDALDKAQATIGKNMDRLVSRGRLSDADRNTALKRIMTNVDVASLESCELVIESATENEAV